MIYMNIHKLNVKKLTALKLTAFLFTGLMTFSVSLVSHAYSPFECPYIGQAIGVSFASARINSGISTRTDFANVAGLLFDANANTSQHLQKSGVAGDIYAGYGFFVWCSSYLGGEISLKIWNPNASSNSTIAAGFPRLGELSTLNDNVSVVFNKLEFDFDLRPGILLSECNLLYGRVGIALTKATLRSDFSAIQVVDPALGSRSSGTLSISNSKNMVGLRLGLGMEQALTGYLSLRLDYVCTIFKRINTNVNQTFNTVNAEGATIPITLNAQRNVRVIDNSFMIGLSYYW